MERYCGPREGSNLGGHKVTVFVASDSERARQAARALAESLGFGVIDAGGLKNARCLEPLAGLNVYFGYGAGLGSGANNGYEFALALLAITVALVLAGAGRASLDRALSRRLA